MTNSELIFQTCQYLAGLGMTKTDALEALNVSRYVMERALRERCVTWRTLRYRHFMLPILKANKIEMELLNGKRV